MTDVYVETPELGVAPEAALTNRTTVRELVVAFAEAEVTVRTTFAVLVRAEERVNALFALGERKTIRINPNDSHRGADFDDPERCIREMRRAAWMCIVDRLEIQRLMSDAEWTKLEAELDGKEKSEPQPITEETVAAFARRYVSDLPGTFQAKVLEVFEWLRPREDTPRAAFKTNEKNARLELGERVILTSAVEPGWGRSKFRVRSYTSQRLTALESVFSTLAGQGYGAHSHRGELNDAIEATQDGTGRTSYFAFRCFKNSNLHLEFVRPDLLRRFNQIAGGMRLRPGEAA